MKQEILCPNCAVEMKRIIGKGQNERGATKWSGENVKFLPGRAKTVFMCDFCGCTIDPLAHCVAFSVWTEERPMIEGWEHNYIVAGEVTT